MFIQVERKEAALQERENTNDCKQIVSGDRSVTFVLKFKKLITYVPLNYVSPTSSCAILS